MSWLIKNKLWAWRTLTFPDRRLGGWCHLWYHRSGWQMITKITWNFDEVPTWYGWQKVCPQWGRGGLVGWWVWLELGFHLKNVVLWHLNKYFFTWDESWPAQFCFFLLLHIALMKSFSSWIRTRFGNFVQVRFKNVLLQVINDFHYVFSWCAGFMSPMSYLYFRSAYSMVLAAVLALTE